MKNVLPFLLSAASTTLLLLGSCKKEDSASPNQTCADEHVLEVYQDREAKVIVADGKKYCLTVDAADVAGNGTGYNIGKDVLVPVTDTDIPSQYQVEGLHVLLSGRKKSCFGLATLSMLSGPFGYKLEVESIKGKGD